MKGLNAKPAGYNAMKNSNIAISHYPFGFKLELTQVYPVQNSYRSVSSTSAKNCLYVRIINHLHEIGSAFAIRPCKLKMFGKEGGCRFHYKTPCSQKPDGRINIFVADKPCRGNNSNSIARFQVWGSDILHASFKN